MRCSKYEQGLTIGNIEMNLAENAQAFKAGKHPGYVETAWLGLQDSLETIAERGIKVVINGGCLNPSGLAARVSSLVCWFSLVVVAS